MKEAGIAQTIASRHMGGNNEGNGLLRELNPGPLGPKPRIMPLDQAATMARLAKNDESVPPLRYSPPFGSSVAPAFVAAARAHRHARAGRAYPSPWRRPSPAQASVALLVLRQGPVLCQCCPTRPHLCHRAVCSPISFRPVYHLRTPLRSSAQLPPS